MFEKCSNCNTALIHTFQYCQKCGQKTHLHRLNLRGIFHDAWHYFTHTDKGILQLVKSLLLKTGTVAKEYVEGKRKKYFPPLKFFLVVAAIYVIAINFFDPPSADSILKDLPEINAMPEQVQKNYVEVIHFMEKYPNVLAMIVVPLIAFILWLFYLRGSYNYTEHLVACMYMTGFFHLIYALILLPLSLLVETKHSSYSDVVSVIFLIAYSSLFYYRFINRQSKGSLIKAIAVSTFAIFFWVPLAGFFVVLYLFVLYVSNALWEVASNLFK